MSYNNVLYILLFYIIEIIKIIIVLAGILDFKFRKEKIVYLALAIPPLCVVLIKQLPFNVFVGLYEAMMPILIIVTMLLIFQGKLYIKIAFTLLTYICVTFFDICIAGIFSIIFDTSLIEIINRPVSNFLSNGINVVIFALIALLKKKSYKNTNKISINMNVYILFFIGASVGIFFIAGLMTTNLPGAEGKIRKAMLFLVILVVFAYFLGCVTLIFLTYSRDNYKKQLQINEQVIKSQQKYYTLVNEKQQEIKSIRHDINNHITCIDALYKGGKHEELRNYINELIEEAKTLEELLDTGNDIVNAIINDTQAKHRDRILIKVEGGFPDELHISSMDLCVIFANAINNAVEAIYKFEDVDIIHVINIKISSFKEDLFIDITNPIKEEVEIVNNKIETSKEDKDFHGFGLNNMKMKAREYGGSIKLESDDKMFYLFIHMKSKRKENNKELYKNI